MSTWRCAVAALTVGAVAAVSPAAAFAAGDVLLVTSKVTATETPGAYSADVTVINTGTAVQLAAQQTVVGESSCLVTVEDPALPPHQESTVTVSFQIGCFPGGADSLGASSFRLDLDGVGSLPPVEIASRGQSQTPWYSLWFGLLAGLVLAAVVWLTGRVVHRSTRANLAAESPVDREQAYAKVKHVINMRWRKLGLPRSRKLEWKPELPERAYELDDPVEGLEAGWSLKDSLLANLTTATAAVVGLLSSSDLLTGLLVDAPTSTLRVTTVAALISAALVALATLLVKLIGPEVDQVTVRGLIISTAVLGLAVGWQVVAVSHVVGTSLDLWGSERGLVVSLATLGVLGIAYWYLKEQLQKTIAAGKPAGGVPAVPEEALDSWRATEEWEKHLVDQRIRTAYQPWLEKDSHTEVRVGAQVPGTGAVIPDPDVRGIADAPAPGQRTRSVF